jgi:aldehyde dehydrogenase (NAD+)
MTTFKNFINGEWVAPSTDAWFDNTNPADTGDLIGRFPKSGAADVQRAVESAKRGFERWKRTPAPARGDVLRRVGEILTARKEELADLMTREMGKPLAETRGDVQEGIDTAFYAAVEGRRLFGHTVPSELRAKWAMSFRRPIGVAGIITPFNFPLAIPTWKMFPALVCGNACIFKPAEDVPHTGHVLVEILLEAGLPPEVIQLVHGDGEVGKAIVDHPEIPLLSFTGSTETGSKVGETAGRMHKRLSLEMGGKNAQIVLDDAKLDLALDGVLWGAFGTTGQRCTATSRLVLQDGIHDRFLAKLKERASQLKLGDGRKAGTDVGPVIHADSIAKIERYVEIGLGEGAELVLGGQRGAREGLLLPADDLRRREGGDADRAGGDLRPGAQRDPGEGRRRGVQGEQRREVRPLVVGLHAGREPRLPRAQRARQRHHVHQRPDDRRRGAPPVRRREADRQRPPRGRVGGLRVLLGDEGRLPGLQRHPPARPDRQ